MIIGTVKQIWRYPVKSLAGETLDSCEVVTGGIPGDRGWAFRDEKTREITNGKYIPLLMQTSARYREEPDNNKVPHVVMKFADGSTIASDEPNLNTRVSKQLGREVTLWLLQPASNKAHYRRASLVSRLVGFKLIQNQLPRILRMKNVQTQVREMFSREAGEPIPDLTTLPVELLEFTSPPGTYFDAFPIHVMTTASLRAMSEFNGRAAWDVRRFRPNFLIETNDEVAGLPEAGWSGRTLRLGSVDLKCELPTVRCGMTMQAQAGLPKDPSVLRSIVKHAEQNLGAYASVSAPGSIRLGDAVELL
ncbi:MAG TPA: MOSC N-terminal beta barrel domain-containing protein [Pyrinomonadaceae bacterium]|jgi:uncharacterized protein YcbX|nr:MOSC N-terminal beta barrel domain-containing protein [Pyrinomonadaceae bacterium]